MLKVGPGMRTAQCNQEDTWEEERCVLHNGPCAQDVVCYMNISDG